MQENICKFLDQDYLYLLIILNILKKLLISWYIEIHLVLLTILFYIILVRELIFEGTNVNIFFKLHFLINQKFFLYS